MEHSLSFNLFDNKDVSAFAKLVIEFNTHGVPYEILRNNDYVVIQWSNGY